MKSRDLIGNLLLVLIVVIIGGLVFYLFFYAGFDGDFRRYRTTVWPRFRRCRIRLSGRNLNYQISVLLHAAFWDSHGGFRIVLTEWADRVDPKLARSSNGRRTWRFLKVKGLQNILAD